MDSTILTGRSPLTTINIKSSKKPTCVASSFFILLEIEKISNIIDGSKHEPSSYQPPNQVSKLSLGQFWDLLLTSLEQNGEHQYVFYSYNVIRLMVCNQKFSTPSVHSQNFKTNISIMTYDRSHDLVMFPIHRQIYSKQCL